MGRWLRQAAFIPDHVFCSTAQRARQTWQLAAAALRENPSVTYEHGIYGASAAGLLDLIRRVPSAARTVVIVGHDPAVQELALALAGAAPDTGYGATDGAPLPDALERMRTKFPTGAIAVLEFSGPWSALGEGRARLATFVTPRELAGLGTE